MKQWQNNFCAPCQGDTFPLITFPSSSKKVATVCRKLVVQRSGARKIHSHFRLRRCANKLTSRNNEEVKIHLSFIIVQVRIHLHNRLLLRLDRGELPANILNTTKNHRFKSWKNRDNREFIGNTLTEKWSEAKYGVLHFCCCFCVVMQNPGLTWMSSHCQTPKIRYTIHMGVRLCQ